MNTDHFTPVPFHDPKRTLCLYECHEEDHLACQEWLDRHLRGDYLFKKQHLKNIITRPTSTMFAVLFDGLYVGTAIVYQGSVLHNIMIAEEWRGLGIGEAVIKFLSPAVIRAKTNMEAGDPVPFYKKLGYEPESLDPLRPHIVVMKPVGEAGGAAAVELNASAPPPQTLSFQTASRELPPPEADSNKVLADKWRALKERQRIRCQRKKEAKAKADREYATRYAPPVSSNGITITAGQDYNTFRD